MDNSNRLDVPTSTLCRAASRYLESIMDCLPDTVKAFIKKYPYTSSLVFALGADSTKWIKNSDRGGWHFMQEVINFNNRRDKGFPLKEMVTSHLFDYEIGLLALLGFNYEIEYMRSQGMKISDYSYLTVEECVKHNDMVFLKQKENEKEYPGIYPHDFIQRCGLDETAIKYFMTREDCEMLLDGGQHIPVLLNEKIMILTEILDRFEVKFNGELITSINDFPGKVKMMGYECLSCNL